MGRVRNVVALSIVVFIVGACAPGAPTEVDRVVPYGGIEVIERLNVKYGPAPTVFNLLDLWRPADAPMAPVVLFVHGGFWAQDLSGARPIPKSVKDLLLHGFSVATMSYRGVNDGAGNVVHPASIHDVKRAVAYLHGLGLDVHLMGFSAGGHLAAMAAMTFGNTAMTPAGITESRVESLVSAAGPTDLPALWAINDGSTFIRQTTLKEYVCGGGPCGVDATMSPRGHVSADDPPALLIYSSGDELVPLSQGATLEDDLDAAGVEATLSTRTTDHDGVQQQLPTAELDAWFTAHP
ncbi:MAG TPA: alpha/beta hydrolase [Microthrixaceae bacterium]|nr:alpha/beta hydrolase [Microthrixaceae bacterium]